MGYARTPMDAASFRALVDESVRTDMIEVNEAVLTEFLSHLQYHQGNYNDVEDFKKLKEALVNVERSFVTPSGAPQDDRVVRVAFL